MGKINGKINWENLWGKITRKINGESIEKVI